ncbi:hypothetical protein ACFPRL_29475 [Pseudoclavibacter helvolus]
MAHPLHGPHRARALHRLVPRLDVLVRATDRRGHRRALRRRRAWRHRASGHAEARHRDPDLAAQLLHVPLRGVLPSVEHVPPPHADVPSSRGDRDSEIAALSGWRCGAHARWPAALAVLLLVHGRGGLDTRLARSKTWPFRVRSVTVAAIETPGRPLH